MITLGTSQNVVQFLAKTSFANEMIFEWKSETDFYILKLEKPTLAIFLFGFALTKKVVKTCSIILNLESK